MKYMLLIHQGSTPTPPSAEWDALSDEEKAAVYADYQAVNQTPGVSPGPRLQPQEAATTVRVERGEAVTTDGPVPPDGLSGYLEFETDDLDAAIGLAARIPAARMGGAIEVRPIAER